VLEPNYCAQQGYPVSSLAGFCSGLSAFRNDADVGATSPFCASQNPDHGAPRVAIGIIASLKKATCRDGHLPLPGITKSRRSRGTVALSDKLGKVEHGLQSLPIGRSAEFPSGD
jgi:hypothetical protein